MQLNQILNSAAETVATFDDMLPQNINGIQDRNKLKDLSKQDESCIDDDSVSKSSSSSDAGDTEMEICSFQTDSLDPLMNDSGIENEVITTCEETLDQTGAYFVYLQNDEAISVDVESAIAEEVVVENDDEISFENANQICLVTDDSDFSKDILDEREIQTDESNYNQNKDEITLKESEFCVQDKDPFMDNEISFVNNEVCVLDNADNHQDKNKEAIDEINQTVISDNFQRGDEICVQTEKNDVVENIFNECATMGKKSIQDNKIIDPPEIEILERFSQETSNKSKEKQSDNENKSIQSNLTCVLDNADNHQEKNKEVIDEINQTVTSDNFQRGDEICVTMGKKSIQDNKIIDTPEIEILELFSLEASDKSKEKQSDKENKSIQSNLTCVLDNADNHQEKTKEVIDEINQNVTSDNFQRVDEICVQTEKNDVVENIFTECVTMGKKSIQDNKIIDTPEIEILELFSLEASDKSKEKQSDNENESIQSNLTANPEENELPLDMPILVLEPDKDLNTELDQSKYSEFVSCLPDKDQEFLRINTNQKSTAEGIDSMTEPVEVSFFSLDEESLVITSDQALGMFESNVTNETVPKDPKINFEGNRAAEEEPLSEMNFVPEENITETTVVENNFVPNDSIQYDFLDAPALYLSSGSSEEVTTSYDVQENFLSAEIEVPNTPDDASSSNIVPQYTNLVPSIPNSDQTSTAVSQTLHNLVGNIPFEAPPDATINTTMDSNGEFVVQVMAPGINMSIPNHYFNQTSSMSNNNKLETISDSDILSAFELDNVPTESYANDKTSDQIAQLFSNGRNELNMQEANMHSQTDQGSIEQLDVNTKACMSLNKNEASKRKANEENTESDDFAPEKKKKCHSSVLAALRQSIFRSKARKFVNQLENDEPLLSKKTSNEVHDPVTIDQNQNYENCDRSPRNITNEATSEVNENYFYDHSPNQYTEDVNPQCERPHPDIMSSASKMRYMDTHYDCHGKRSVSNGHDYRFYSHHKNPCNRRRFRCNQSQPLTSPRHCSKFSSNRCQEQCCATPFVPWTDPRDPCCSSKRPIRSPPIASSSFVGPKTSCCNGSSHSSNHEPSTGPPPYMMLRPEDLTSMMKDNASKAKGGAPFVMMPSHSDSTDGDPLRAQLVYVVYPMDGRTMSADTLRNPYIRHQRDMHKSVCGNNNCSSSSCYDQFPSHDSSPTMDKDTPWEVSALHADRSLRPNPSSPSSANTEYEDNHMSDDHENYLRKPINEWGYADVIFFLMDACREIRVDPTDVKIKKTDTGAVLLNMSPNDFEALVPNNGQTLYDHFMKFKTQHYVSSNCASYPNYCNDQYLTQQNMPQMPVHMNEPHHSYEDNFHHAHGHYSHYPNEMHSQPYHHHPNFSPSGSNGYMPQGVQYTDSPFSPVDELKTYHELPSAARKTFPPLHNYDDPISDPEASDEEEKPPEPPKKRGPGRPPKPENERKRKAKKTGRLWEFIRNLLLDPKTCPSLVRWEDPSEGVFRIVQSDAIASKWGMRKNNEKMNYEKLSRAMRYYYKAKIFEPVWGKRLVYKFGCNARGWRPLNPANPNFQSPT